MFSKSANSLPSTLLACYRVDFFPLILLGFIAWKDYYDSTGCFIPTIFEPLNDFPLDF